jgi:limonene-1,2-epoxide hydrolase
VSIIEVKDGQIANMRDYFDLMTGMSQLGLLPGT